MAYSSAKKSKIRIGALVHKAREWEVSGETTQVTDTSDFEGGGFTDAEGNLRKVEGSVKGFLDLSAGVFTTLGIYEGATLANLKLYLNDTTGPYWDFPSVLVKTAKTGAVVDNMLTFEFTFTNKGTYTPPAAA